MQLSQQNALSPNRLEAIKLILDRSSLSKTHQIRKYINLETGEIDLSPMTNHLHWSSGERVLVEAIKVIATYHSELHLSDLWLLDASNRIIIIEAINLALTERAPSIAL